MPLYCAFGCVCVCVWLCVHERAVQLTIAVTTVVSERPVFGLVAPSTGDGVQIHVIPTRAKVKSLNVYWQCSLQCLSACVCVCVCVCLFIIVCQQI